MKHILLLTLSLIMLSTVAVGQVNVEFNINHQAAGQDFALNTDFAAPDGYQFNAERLEYYISGIELVHDGGMITSIDSMWILVDASQTSSYSLGSHNITELEGINFWIGVDAAHNHLDPATWPAGHALAPTFPSMHWGWASGYRFVAFEGTAGAINSTFQIHALGDSNYDKVELTTSGSLDGSTLTVEVIADYAGMLQTIDVSSGLIEHSETAEARTLLRNMTSLSHVFTTSDMSTTVTELERGLGVQLFPNPTSTGTATLSLEEPLTAGADLAVYDEQGRLVQQQRLSQGTNQVQLPTVAGGVYLVTLSTADGVLAQRRWVVTER